MRHLATPPSAVAGAAAAPSPSIVELARARRRRSRVALLVALDGVAEARLALGRAGADAALAAITERVALLALGRGDVVGPVGDELGVLLTAADLGDARVLAEQVVESLRVPMYAGSTPLAVGVRVGVAAALAPDEEPESMLRRARVAAETARGRAGAVETYDVTRDVFGPRRIELAGDLWRAPQSGEMSLVYQPLVDINRMRVTTVEALVRWQHSRLGTVPPEEFIAIAEATGSIHALTDWVLGQALAQCRRWRDQGCPLRVAVNVAAANLVAPGFSTRVRRALAEFGLAGNALEIEITETTVVSDFTTTRDVLAELRGMGVLAVVDDFGVGYSCMSQLRDLPVAALKVDRSFLARGLREAADLEILRSIVHLARALGIEAVAEGVEDADTLRCVRDERCARAQGYHIARPMAADRLAAWMHGRSVAA